MIARLVRRLLGRGLDPPPRPSGPAEEAKEGPKQNAPPASNSPVDLSRPLEATAFGSGIAAEITEHLRTLLVEEPTQEGKEHLMRVLRAVTNDGLTLPSMPHALLRIQNIINAPDADIRELVSAISEEPAVATRLVGIANAPFFSGLSEVRGLEHAIARLGFLETRNIVMAILCQARVFRCSGRKKLADSLYRNAMANAFAARSLAPKLRVPVDEAFMAGLICEMGRTIVFNLIPSSTAQTTIVVPSSAALLADRLHAPLSALVAESWSFPKNTMLALYHHHDWASAPESSLELASLLSAANELATLLCPIASDHAPIDSAIEMSAVNALGFMEDLNSTLDTVRNGMAAFGCAPSEQPTRRH